VSEYCYDSELGVGPATEESPPLLAKGILAPHGKLVCYGSNLPADIPVSFTAMLWGSLTLQLFLVYELTPAQRRAATDELMRLLEEDRLTHAIGARFPLDEIAAAHEAVEGGEVIGNVVLEIG
jgi:NADPH:quinone reductase